MNTRHRIECTNLAAPAACGASGPARSRAPPRSSPAVGRASRLQADSPPAAKRESDMLARKLLCLLAHARVERGSRVLERHDEIERGVVIKAERTVNRRLPESECELDCTTMQHLDGNLAF